MPSALPSDRFFEEPGQPRLRYRDEGRGPAIVLVHGWLLDLTMWDELAQALVPQFRVIRWDRRGFGESAGEPSLGSDVADAARLLRHLGVQQRAVLGMSQGCRIALALAEAAPDLTTALVLDGAPPVDGLPDRQWRNETPVFEYRALLVDRGIDALREVFARHPLLQLETNDLAMHERMQRMLNRYAGADLLALPASPPAAPANTVTPERFARLPMPALTLNGANDTEQRRTIGALLAQLLPRARHATVAHAKHMACWDNPAAYNAIVRTFLADTLSQGPAAPGAT